MKKIAVLLLAGMAAGCASEYTIVDVSHTVVSDNTRNMAGAMIPGAQKHSKVIELLALAQEVHEKQFNLLKERRNKVRARKRAFDLSSYITLAGTAGVTSGLAFSAIDSKDQTSNLKTIGLASLVGMGIGTGLQIGGYMQEDASAVDDKIRHLEEIYDAMLANLRNLALSPDTDPGIESQMSATINSFIKNALQINIKG